MYFQTNPFYPKVFKIKLLKKFSRLNTYGDGGIVTRNRYCGDMTNYHKLTEMYLKLLNCSLKIGNFDTLLET